MWLYSNEVYKLSKCIKINKYTIIVWENLNIFENNCDVETIICMHVMPPHGRQNMDTCKFVTVRKIPEQWWNKWYKNCWLLLNIFRFLLLQILVFKGLFLHHILQVLSACVKITWIDVSGLQLMEYSNNLSSSVIKMKHGD